MDIYDNSEVDSGEDIDTNTDMDFISQESIALDNMADSGSLEFWLGAGAPNQRHGLFI